MTAKELRACGPTYPCLAAGPSRPGAFARSGASAAVRWGTAGATSTMARRQSVYGGPTAWFYVTKPGNLRLAKKGGGSDG